MTTRDPAAQAATSPAVDFYDSTYARFGDTLYREIRRDTWHDDFGQNGWITAPEQDQFIQWLALKPGRRVLDIACGSGGPALRMAAQSGASIVGIDIHPDGIKAGQHEAERRGLSALATFQVIDAQRPLPFDDSSFDAVVCIDAINHLADRTRVLREWARILKPGGHLLFTDPAVVTGPLTNHEIAARSSIGFFLFVPADTNDRAIADAGLRLTAKADLSDALAHVATNWHAARQKRADELRSVESAETFEGQQHFLTTAAQLAQERRLSRPAYLASKP